MNKAFKNDRAAITHCMLPPLRCVALVFPCSSAQTLGYAQADSTTSVVVAVGDISCDPSDSHFNRGQGTRKYCHMEATSNLAISMRPVAVLILGDSQYEKGMSIAFQKS